MLTISELRALHADALADCGEFADRAARTDLRLPTPCDGWDLAALLGHMTGQNLGFAVAVERGDAELSAYEPPPIAPDTLQATWTASAAGSVTPSPGRTRKPKSTWRSWAGR